MTQPDRTPRRGFLARIAAGAAAFAAGGAMPAAAQPAPSGQTHPNDRWLDTLTGRHRQIYDVETPARVPVGLAYARNFLNASTQPYGLTDRELSVVVSLRHTAVSFALGDSAWDAYKLGEYVPQQDPDTSAPARRNPHLGAAGAPGSAAATFRALHERGVVFSVCGLSFARMVRELAGRTGHTQDAVRAALTSGLVPGAVVVTAGVVALNRAQERGFSYIGVG